MSSFFIATSILAFGGLGLFMLKTNNSNDTHDTESHLENNTDEYIDKENIEDELEWFEPNREVKNSKNIRTRRNKKNQRSSRRRL